ncbi:hypothetical protein SPF06_13775 [Sinomonas sp. JGH33]|uniref:DUF4386 domain-containing protein n=1 Tax=Sinomonas terricola TaxID=3110330 RepID=A0ABU5T800_9MICC|nr:hypothetical protein [Sinomonas sp. JGH33]MEA5455799.1 hypothetical protein [Sinomonas sp. JGH33]
MTDLTAPTADPKAARPARRPDGPNAGILAIVVLVLSIATVALPALAAGALYPSPSASSDAVARYFADHSFSAALTGFLAFGASVPLGIYVATTYARLLRLGIRVPGPNIGFFGGIASSVMQGASGLVIWALSQTASETPGAFVHLVADAAFALGGFGFATGAGLLIAGTAVPALILRLTPRWLAWTGLVLAAAGEISFLGMFWPAFDYLLPVVRFAGLAWLAVVGFTLPRNRHEVPRRGE